MVDRWTNAQLVNAGYVSDLNNTLGSADQILRPIVHSLEKAKDVAGAAAAVVRALFAGSPQDAILRAVQGILQSLINDLLESGVYSIFHHNLPEGLLRLGIANTVPDLGQDLPRVPTGLAANPGPNSELQDLESGVSETLITDLSTYHSNVPSFRAWLSDIARAFEDPLDSKRPQVSQNASIGGFLFVTGGTTLADLVDLIEALARILQVREALMVWPGLEEIFDQDWKNLARFRDAALFLPIQDTAFGARGEPPNFRSAKASSLIPGFNNILISMATLLDALNAASVATNQVASLIEATEARLESIAGAFDQMRNFIRGIAGLLSIQGTFSVLPLPLESGGIPRLQDRMSLALDPPDLGPGNLIVGGGVFTTTTTGYEVLARLFMGEEGANLGDLFGADFTQSSYEGGIADPGRFGSQGEQAPGFYGARRDDSEETHSGGGARRGVRIPGTAPGDLSEGTLGSWAGGLRVRRSSWGTCTQEHRESLVVVEDNEARLVESPTGTYVEAHTPPDGPRYQDVRLSDGSHITGLLIEGERTNTFFDSDRLREMSLTEISLSEHARSSPTVDLRRRRNEAGTTVEAQTTNSWPSGFSSPKGIVDVTIQAPGSTCSVSIVSGSGPTTGDYLIGRQEITVHGRTYYAPVRIRVGLDIGPIATGLSPYFFLPPIASSWTVEGLFVITSDIPSELEQTLPWAENFWSFSVFARHRSTSPWLRGMAAQFKPVGVIAGPHYGVHADLDYVTKRTLWDGAGGGDYVDGVFSLPASAGPTLVEGDAIAIVDTTAVNSDLRVITDVTDEVGGVSFRAVPLRDPEETFLDLEVDANLSIYVLDLDQTYWGFQRVGFELPYLHKGQTQALDPGISTYAMQHENVSTDNLRVYIVLPSSLTELDYDPTQTQLLSYDVSAGTPTSLIPSADVKSNYEGFLLEYHYPLPYTNQGTLSVVPIHLTDGSGTAPDPSIGTALELWRAQWETGGRSSSIPTKRNAVRVRSTDEVTLPGSGYRLLGQGLRLLFSIYPQAASETIIDSWCLVSFQDDFYLELEVVSRSPEVQVRAHLHMSGSDLYTDFLQWDKEDNLSFVLEMVNGATQLEVAINGILVDTASANGFPTLDSILQTDATLRIGARSDGQSPGWFVLQDIAMKDAT